MDKEKYDDWLKYMEFRFAKKAKELGIDISYLCVIGFFSECESTYFTAFVSNWESLLRSIGYDNPVLIDLAKLSWSAVISYNSRYNTVGKANFYIDTPNPSGTSDDRQFIQAYSPYNSSDVSRNASWLVALRTFDYDNIRQGIKQKLISTVDYLYHELKAEFERLEGMI